MTITFKYLPCVSLLVFIPISSAKLSLANYLLLPTIYNDINKSTNSAGFGDPAGGGEEKGDNMNVVGSNK